MLIMIEFMNIQTSIKLQIYLVKFTVQINDKISIGGVFSMVSEKGDVTITDTINKGYVWASTNTITKSRSGSASTEFNQIIIFGKIILINQLI